MARALQCSALAQMAKKTIGAAALATANPKAAAKKAAKAKAATKAAAATAAAGAGDAPGKQAAHSGEGVHDAFMAAFRRNIATPQSVEYTTELEDTADTTSLVKNYKLICELRKAIQGSC